MSELEAYECQISTCYRCDAQRSDSHAWCTPCRDEVNTKHAREQRGLQQLRELAEQAGPLPCSMLAIGTTEPTAEADRKASETTCTIGADV